MILKYKGHESDQCLAHISPAVLGCVWEHAAYIWCSFSPTPRLPLHVGMCFAPAAKVWIRCWTGTAQHASCICAASSAERPGRYRQSSQVSWPVSRAGSSRGDHTAQHSTPHSTAPGMAGRMRLVACWLQAHHEAQSLHVGISSAYMSGCVNKCVLIARFTWVG